MGTQGKKIIDLDIDELISLLNKSLADEWLAYYQYWIGSKIIKGKNSEIIKKELEEHAEEELKHANMITDRILEIGGVPILNPNKWKELSSCGFEEPTSFLEKDILNQNIKGERCAIAVYKKLLSFTKDKDILTYEMTTSILKDEVEHENDLEKLLEDITC